MRPLHAIPDPVISLTAACSSEPYPSLLPASPQRALVLSYAHPRFEAPLLISHADGPWYTAHEQEMRQKTKKAEVATG